MGDLNIYIAFFAGLASFFAPCVIPLVPTYIAYVTGTTLKEIYKKRQKGIAKRIITSGLFYVLGFSIFFVILGAFAGGLGLFLRKNSIIFSRIGGLLIILFGLEFMGFVRLPGVSLHLPVKFSKPLSSLNHIRSFFLGVIFSLSWVPCIGAVLGSILTLTAVTQTALRGSFLLFVYSLGMSLPFVLFSLILSQSSKYTGKITKYLKVINIASGVLLIILGLLLLTNTYRYLNSWLFEIAYKFGYIIK